MICGRDYLPPWIYLLGLGERSFAAALGLGYLVAYFLGCLVEAPQKTFNRARLIYENQVAAHGYWFDHYLSSTFSYDEQQLARAAAIFTKISAVLDVMPAETSLLLQRKMVHAYQTALLAASQQKYRDSLAAVRAAKGFRERHKDSDIWLPGEYETVKSQMLFLEAELLIVQGDRNTARSLLMQALAIDTQRGDVSGQEVIDKRLQVVAQDQ
jgi:hypothetical protein